MNLTDLIQVNLPASREEDDLDIFASTPGLIFTDDVRNMHGDPDATIIYKSRRFGDIELRTADPDRQDERLLFAHYLWNAGIRMAEFISQGEEEEEKDDDDPRWSLKGETVLELGAGVGLDGIVATLAGAAKVVVSDYPAKNVLDNIRRNVERSVPSSLRSKCLVQGYEWGDVEGEFARQNANRFSRVIAADCYWMSNEHENLVRSMLHFLDFAPDSRIFTIAGFHTGRAKLAQFFDIIVSQGLEIEEIYEEDTTGVRRDWAKERNGGAEDPIERKKWLVIARLMRRADQT